MHLRQLGCEFGVLARADGAARWRSGQTEVLAGVMGPTHPLRGEADKGEGVSVEVNFSALNKGADGTPGSSFANTTASNKHRERIIRGVVEPAILRCVRRGCASSVRTRAADGAPVAADPSTLYITRISRSNAARYIRARWW